jgi:hypothetical protein
LSVRLQAASDVGSHQRVRLGDAGKNRLWNVRHGVKKRGGVGAIVA